MEIDAINAAAKLNIPSQPPADAQHIAKFAQLMQQVEPATPMISPDQFCQCSLNGCTPPYLLI